MFINIYRYLHCTGGKSLRQSHRRFNFRRQHFPLLRPLLHVLSNVADLGQHDQFYGWLTSPTHWPTISWWHPSFFDLLYSALQRLRARWQRDHIRRAVAVLRRQFLQRRYWKQHRSRETLHRQSLHVGRHLPRVRPSCLRHYSPFRRSANPVCSIPLNLISNSTEYRVFLHRIRRSFFKY